MKCTKCNNKLSSDAIFCNKCGQKVHIEKVYVENVELDTKHTISKNSMKKNLLLVFIFFAVVCALSVFFGRFAVVAIQNGEFASFFTKIKPTVATSKISDKTDTTAKPSPTAHITTPPNQKTIVKLEGFSSKNIFYNNEIFSTGEQVGIFKTDLLGDNLQILIAESVDSLFVTDEFIYYLEPNIGILSMDHNGTNTTVLVSDTISEFYMDENFIFYTRKNNDMTYSLYRVSKDGSNSTLVKENINEFIVDEYTDKIYYTTLIQNNNYDSKNHFEKFATIPNDTIENSNYFTLSMCDFAGGADVKLVEISVSADFSENAFSNINLISDQMLLKVNYKDKYNNTLFLLDLNSLKYEIIDSVSNYKIFNEEIYYNSLADEKTSLVKTIKYSPITFIKEQISENIAYSNIQIANETIYYNVDNQLLFSTDLKGENKKYLITSDNITEFGNFIQSDDNKTYFTNVIIENDLSEFTFINREKAIKETFISNVSTSSNDWQDAYSNYLLNLIPNNNLTKFGICDIDGDGIPELLVGNNRNNFSNVKTLNIESVKILYYDKELKEYNSPIENIFSVENNLFKHETDKKLVSFYSINESYFTSYISIDKATNTLIVTPLLKRDLLPDSTYKYYNFVTNYIEISPEEYSTLSKELEEQSIPISQNIINGINILKNIYLQK